VLLLAAANAGAQTVAIPFTSTVQLESALDQVVFVLDLGTLPNRADLAVRAVAPAAPSAQILLETTNAQIANPVGNCNVVETVSPLGVGPKEIHAPFHLACYSDGFPCEPSCTDFSGDTLDLRVSVPAADARSYPIDVDLVVEASTVVPSGSLFVEVPPSQQQTRTFLAAKDTVIYERFPANSNGEGFVLWAAADVSFSPFTIDLLRTLVAFDFAGPELGRVPAGARVDDATLEMDVITLGVTGVAVERVAPDGGPMPSSWPEGDANDSANDGRVGALSTTPAATWDDRDDSGVPWSVAGGDPTGGVLVSLDREDLVFGPNGFSSPAFIDAVADMVETGEDEDGFVLSPTGRVLEDGGTRFYSRHVPGFGPRLHVTYTASQIEGVPGGETIDTDVRSFIGEGDDFRWVYDLDGDDVLVTDIGGVCSIANSQIDAVPWTYSYSGDPAFTGLDCCLWQVDSPETDTMGAGQAVFFHNLDPLDPANLPPDRDGDGIVDGCDNCQWVPNGPRRGSCLSGASAGSACLSDLECSNRDCSLAQEDDDLDGVGQACPEPELATGLALGLLAMAGLGSRRPH
jgi:hypothetical protein